MIKKRDVFWKIAVLILFLVSVSLGVLYYKEKGTKFDIDSFYYYYDVYRYLNPYQLTPENFPLTYVKREGDSSWLEGYSNSYLWAKAFKPDPTKLYIGLETHGRRCTVTDYSYCLSTPYPLKFEKVWGDPSSETELTEDPDFVYLVFKNSVCGQLNESQNMECLSNKYEKVESGRKTFSISFDNQNQPLLNYEYNPECGICGCVTIVTTLAPGPDEC